MERKWHRLAEEEAREGTDRALTAYRVPLSQVTSFKYLGQDLETEGNDWLSLVRNINRVRQKWVRLTQVLIK